ncbi:1-aminocyclopropane-1-carboxylate oxidase [Quillaja saponaria]|uniref:1-aminocyclopropane-1-carboxylate oxidase n=1 Tax=Quillaja saponaria TaxID=32244 RepID=A0AAD7LC83_QUISA|nr:1-aminocyclopropane-1-carboxylate oxidase [Quillaja saponaria]
MDGSGNGVLSSENNHSGYDRAKELKAFDDTKAGVKGLVDAGIVKLPKIFIRPQAELARDLIFSCNNNNNWQVPVIDLGGIRSTSTTDNQHKKIVDEIRIAAEWGLFQAANWMDTLAIRMVDSNDTDLELLPPALRVANIAYIKHVKEPGEKLFEILSEALGLKPDHLRAMGFTKGYSFAGQYYPPCPEPELALGISKHSDPTFLTILLQDQMGGLQIHHEDTWVDVYPILGAL